jgi:hypothetical protein
MLHLIRRTVAEKNPRVGGEAKTCTPEDWRRSSRPGCSSQVRLQCRSAGTKPMGLQGGCSVPKQRGIGCQASATSPQRK